MRLITIDSNNEPQCLKDLRDNGSLYDDLKGECKQEVTNILREQQQEYCAYCEQRFKSSVFIEHYISQSQDPNRVLVFNNLLGTCSGKYYLNDNDKHTNHHRFHCGNSRGNIPLNINPKLNDHIVSIYYENDGSIRSTNTEYDNDLDQTLNLNFQELKDMRGYEFKNSFANLFEVANLLEISKQDAYNKALRAAASGKVEFAGYITYRYKKLLEAE
ncbi:MAG TPA: retron system putative HNH endonuclease [Saprospiraceae bacterium]|nr:retron system putative HNH endonuclease [Saprospiraceae bacterium]